MDVTGVGVGAEGHPQACDVVEVVAGVGQGNAVDEHGLGASGDGLRRGVAQLLDERRDGRRPVVDVGPAAGLVGDEPDDAVAMSDDPSRTSNRAWLEKLTGHRVVAVAPRADPDNVHPELGRIDLNILDSLARVNWWSALRPPAQLAIR